MGRLRKNTIVSLTAQIVNLVCAFILPRVMLRFYGSEVNGLISSINQFLHMIAFLELGVGAVVESSLYKPLSENDNLKISQIMTSATSFFRKIAFALLCYLIVLIVVYPRTVATDFKYFDVVILIVALSVFSFAQYYFGIVNSLLLNADQRVYIVQGLGIVCTILNTLVSVLLIFQGFSIQSVKVISACIFLLKPFLIRLYVVRNYSVNCREKYDVEPIAQKWYGIAQHVAAFVLDGTDVIVLTVFSTLLNVSIYSVYQMVTNGIRSLVLSSTTGIQASIGRLIAIGDKKKLDNTFAMMEWIIHTTTTIVFGCAMVLIVPFVKIYTHGINDTDYVNYSFAILITLAQGFRCIRLPYNVAILAGGHYKQTQSNYIVAAILNISISVLSVIRFGLVGVAMGTLAAFLYQNVWMAHYISNHIVCWPFRNFIKQSLTDVVVVLFGYFSTRNLYFGAYTYFYWMLNGLTTALIWIVISMTINMILYKQRVLMVWFNVKHIF